MSRLEAPKGTEPISNRTAIVNELCRVIPENEVPAYTRAKIRLGFLAKACSIPSPVKPERKLDYFYCHCKVHGYYQTYQQGRGWLECPDCRDRRLTTVSDAIQPIFKVPESRPYI